MMKQRCGRLAPLIVILLGLSACESGLPAGHGPTSPRPSASAVAPADPQRCARLAGRGFTPCPPTADRLQLPPTTIRNATNGAVSDATAQQWGRAFQLAQAYYYWAMQNNARGALTSGLLADASPQAVSNLFGTDLMDLDDAKRAGGTLVYQPLNMPLTQVVTIPPSLQEKMQAQGLQAKGHGLAVKFTGPASRTVRLADARIVPLRDSAADYSATGLVWGELRLDPDLGPIWFESGAYGCDGEVRATCQL
ncbi:MAG TPA: hypothetical protein VGO86_09525 [Candidatus Dormibacteraeota bacterium]